VSQLSLHRVAVNLAFFINGFIYASWTSRLPRIMDLYHVGLKEIGVLLFVLSVGAVGAMPFTGWAIIKNGSRRITILVAVLYCVIVPLIPFMQEWNLLMVLYLGMGVVTGMLDVAMNAQAVMVEQQYQKPIMTSFHAFFSVGMALGAGCGAAFAHFNVDIQLHFAVITALALVATVWLSGNLIHDKPDDSTNHEGPLFRSPNKAMAGVGLIAFCCMTGEGSMADWSVEYMEKIAGSSKGLAPIAMVAFAAAMLIGRLFGDAVRLAIGDRKLIILGGTVATMGLGIGLAIPLPGVMIAGSFLVGLGLSTIVPIAYSIAGNARDLPPGVGLAMVTTVGYSGFLMGPPVIGFIAEWQNLRIALIVVAFLLIVMTLLGALRKEQH
jgi:MFS family permease